MSSLRFASALLALTVGAAACTSPPESDSSPPVTNLDGEQIVLTSALETVDNCDALLERLKDEAVERVGPYGFNDGFDDRLVLTPLEAASDESMEDSGGFDAPAAELTSDAGSARQAGEDFSETNNQEAGVDEADLVKTDGRRLVAVNGNIVRVLDVENDVPELINSIRLPDDFYGGELFLKGDTALLMTSGWTNSPLADSGIATDWYPGSPTGRIMELDLNAGVVNRVLEFEGGFLSAREVDGSIRIVMSAAGDRFNFVFPSNSGAEESAEKANRDLIEESTIDMWIPTYRITKDGDTVSEGPIVDCNRVYIPTEFAGFGSLVVLTADIDDGLSINDSVSVFTDGQTVYASPDRLAVAAPRSPERNENGEIVNDDNYRTAIHTFDISDPDKTEFAASGSVRGYLLSQYSMSEYEGYLRVATTDGTPWDSRSSESFVTVLAENGGELSEVGQVGGLGEGETIFAVRFMGDKGYVVTFEQIDPLYTVDLSDPTNPRVTGALKIPGVSEYLHVYGDYLLAVGTDGDENGLTGGSVVSVFDVSDPANPTQVDKLSLAPGTEAQPGESGSYSPVASDPRAFNIWGDTMIVPVSWWQFSSDEVQFNEDTGNAAVLIGVGDNGELTRIGQVGHPATTQCEGGLPSPREVDGSGVQVEAFEVDSSVSNTPDTDTDTPDTETPDPEAEAGTPDPEAEHEDAEAELVRPDIQPPADDDVLGSRPEKDYCFSNQPNIQRSVVIGDNLYTVSDAGIAVNKFDGLDTVTWIPFDR